MAVDPDRIKLSGEQVKTLLTIVNYFTARGWPVEAGFGIAANIYAECSFRPHLTGDGGRAYGICQWDADRQAKYQHVFRESIKGASLEDQLAFVWWELTKSKPDQNREREAGRALSVVTSAAEAGAIFSREYERPKLTDIEAKARGSLAAHWFGLYGKQATPPQKGV